MVDVVTQMRISRPAAEVAEYASNPENAPDWYVNIKSAQWKTPKPLTVGSRIAFHATFLGRKLDYTYEITELKPGIRLTMETSEGPFPMKTIYSWEVIDSNTTLMTLRNKGVPSGISTLFAPLMASSMKKANNHDLQRLKQILEK